MTVAEELEIQDKFDAITENDSWNAWDAKRRLLRMAEQWKHETITPAKMQNVIRLL